jgi:hypothetical protein
MPVAIVLNLLGVVVLATIFIGMVWAMNPARRLGRSRLRSR